MTFAVIVQARMNSTRLPGKVLEPLGAATALERCLARCAAIPGVDRVVCAVPSGPDDDEIAAEAFNAGAFVVRGSEHDVLSRYALAARAVKADIVMRVTSDCPFIDPELCAQVRDALVENEADYACNHAPPLWPHGLDCDAFRAEHLFHAARHSTDPAEREHVTIGMRARPDFKIAAVTGPGGGVEAMRWTLDYAEDLAFCRAVFAAMGEAAATARWTEIAELCSARPDIGRLNAHLVDQARFASGLPAAKSA